MKNWKNPEISTIYLANGEQATAHVNGISPKDGSGYALVHGREVKVAPLPDTWQSLGYGEIVSIALSRGETIEGVLTPDDYIKHVAHLYRDPDSIEATICVFDAGVWREMTEEEYKQERRAWEEDMKDMAQIKREWQDYRESE